MELGSEIEGQVISVVDFGAFVDIGCEKVRRAFPLLLAIHLSLFHSFHLHLTT